MLKLCFAGDTHVGKFWTPSSFFIYVSNIFGQIFTEKNKLPILDFRCNFSFKDNLNNYSCYENQTVSKYTPYKIDFT